FSSRRRHTRSDRDWSSDVCSSDLAVALPEPDRALAAGELLRVGELEFRVRHAPGHSPGCVVFEGEGAAFAGDILFQGSIGRTDRSEERRVGKEWGAWWSEWSLNKN